MTLNKGNWIPSRAMYLNLHLKSFNGNRQLELQILHNKKKMVL